MLRTLDRVGFFFFSVSSSAFGTSRSTTTLLVGSSDIGNYTTEVTGDRADALVADGRRVTKVSNATSTSRNVGHV